MSGFFRITINCLWYVSSYCTAHPIVMRNSWYRGYHHCPLMSCDGLQIRVKHILCSLQCYIFLNKGANQRLWICVHISFPMLPKEDNFTPIPHLEATSSSNLSSAHSYARAVCAVFVCLKFFINQNKIITCVLSFRDILWSPRTYR